MNKCHTCKKETSNPKFCSRSCSASYNNKRHPKRKRKIVYCLLCEEIVERRQRKYCINCLHKWRWKGDITLGEAIYTKHHKSSAFALIRSRARRAIKSRVQVCDNCGYNKHVEVCHIKSISEFDLDTLLSLINSDENLVLFCPNCHWEFDKGILQIKQVSVSV